MNKKSYSQILDRVARDRLAANTDLTPRILARIQKGKPAIMQPRTSKAVLWMKVFATAFLILLVLAIALISVPSVRAAIQRWFGYVPGIGLVSEGQIRVLDEMVSIQRDGITLRIEQVLVDSNQTTVVYSVEGLTMEMLDASPIGKTHGCYQDAILRWPDHELSPTDQAGTSWITGYQHRASYPVIPSTVDEITFVLSCIRSALPGKAPENWELSFHLIPAPPELTAFPVIEISTPVEATRTAPVPIEPNRNGSTERSTNLPVEGISITLDRAVQMDDGYLIYATLHWENTGFGSVDVGDSSTIHLLDANGQEIPYTIDYDAIATSSFSLERGQAALAIRTGPIQAPGSLRLVLDSVPVMVAAPLDASFTFDPGPDPQPGQVWELTQDLDVGYGHSLRILRATYSSLDGIQAALDFEMESKTGVTGAMAFDNAHPLAGAGGGGGGSSTGTFHSGFSYKGALPEGPLTIHVESIFVIVPGPWQAEWILPEIQTAPSSQPSACLTRESWEQALQAHASLPTRLNGTLALANVPPPDYHYQVSVARLDGSDLKSIGYGSAPSLSPDGTRVVYMGPAVDAPADGLYITDLVSGNTTRLPGTTRGDMNPLWSPDGQKIAFTRGPSSGLIGAPGPYRVVVTNVDGSNARQLTKDGDVNYAMAWMPDGKQLLYTVPARDGVSLHIMDIQTKESSFLFDINYNGSVVISPDGKRLAFEEKLPLDKYGLFVSDVDGSNRVLLADGDPYIVTVPAWSPNGNWIIASVHDPNMNNQPNPMLALISIGDCHIIPLPKLGGYASSWQP